MSPRPALNPERGAQGFFQVVPTDISDDYLIDPAIDVVVPKGAAYLIVAPFSL